MAVLAATVLLPSLARAEETRIVWGGSPEWESRIEVRTER